MTNFRIVIHLIPKWRPINYSFVCMLISPLRLIFTSKFFCFLYVDEAKRVMNMQTKEYFIGRHFGIRSIDDLVFFVDTGTLLFEIN